MQSEDSLTSEQTDIRVMVLGSSTHERKCARSVQRDAMIKDMPFAFLDCPTRVCKQNSAASEPNAFQIHLLLYHNLYTAYR